ncbi:MAG TPA: HtaA domain-containing protein, partial [Solirubrobacterales bacterium]|nr:HtaA domain-containing protein [Solirubrobacterales bacterium]
MSRLESRAVPDLRSDRLATALVVLATIAVTLLASAAPPAAAAEFEITDGELEWNVKESWRDYVTTGSQVGDGAEITGWLLDGEGNSYAKGFSFPVSSGSFDDETDTTTLQLAGYVHFQYWCGLIEPGKCPLDTKFSDLEIEIGPGAQVLRGTHTGYHRTDPGGEIHIDENVVLAKFDIAGATTSFDAGQSRWSEIPTVAGPGFSIYTESTVLDETAFEYT